jgi:hypothetical protein
MDEKRVVELQKFVGAITDPKITAFIDLKKLHQSGIYNLAIQMASDHAIQYGDFGYINHIFRLMDGTPHAQELISALRPKLSFVVTDTKPRKLKKATPEQAVKAAKTAPNKPVAARTAPLKPTRKKAASAKKHWDLLDSPLRLPGSFGSGKRR